MTTISLSSDEDYYEWVIDDVVMQKFSTGQIYNTIREHRPLVPWKGTIWNTRGIPKHSFLTWLFVLNRCPTRDRLLNWGLTTDPNCLLCNSGSESRDHLYFQCDYSYQIWSRISMRCQLTVNRNWNGNFDSMQRLIGPKEKKIVTLIAWQCTIYLLWSERNNRLHRNIFKPAESIINTIDGIVRNRSSSFRDSNPALASSMLQFWFASKLFLTNHFSSSDRTFNDRIDCFPFIVVWRLHFPTRLLDK